MRELYLPHGTVLELGYEAKIGEGHASLDIEMSHERAGACLRRLQRRYREFFGTVIFRREVFDPHYVLLVESLVVECLELRAC